MPFAIIGNPKSSKPKTDTASIDVTVKGMYYQKFNVGDLSLGQEVKLKRDRWNTDDPDAALWIKDIEADRSQAKGLMATTWSMPFPREWMEAD